MAEALPPPYEVHLRSVRWEAGSTSLPPWWLEAHWTQEFLPGQRDRVVPLDRLALQLYADAALAKTVGRPVTVEGWAGRWSLEQAGVDHLDPKRQYWLAVQSGPGGMWTSNGLAVLHTPATLQHLHLEGDRLELAWAPPAAAPFDGYEAALLDATGDPVGWTARIDGRGCPGATPATACWRFDAGDVPFDAAGPLQLVLSPTLRSGQGGDSRGPAAAATVLGTAPSLLVTAYQGNGSLGGPSYRLTVTGVAGEDGAPPQFDLRVAVDGVPRWSAVRPGTAGPDDSTWFVDLDLPATLPGLLGPTATAAGAALSVTAARTEGLSTGPASQPSALLTAVPALASAAYAAGVLTVDIAYPPGPAPHSAARVTVVGNGATVAETLVSGDSGTLAFTATPGTDYVAWVAAVAGASVGPPSAALPLLTAAPVATAVGYDGTAVQASWEMSGSGEVPGLRGYRVSVRSGGEVAASATVDAGAAAFDLPAGTAAATLEVAMVGDVATGPPCAAIPLILDAPALTGVQTDAVTGRTTVTWAPHPGGGYLLQTLVDGIPSGAPVATTDTTAPLPARLPAGADVAVTVAATATAGRVTVTGPPSPPLPLCTAIAAVARCDYDGDEVEVAWSPVANSTHYVASLLADGSPAPLAQAQAPSGSTAVRFPAPLTDPARTYAVTVQAAGAAGSGPPAPPHPLFDPAWFFAPESSTIPYLVPASTFPAASLAATAHDITVALPQLGTAPIATVADASFSLESSGDAAFPYRLRILQKGLAWQFDPSGIQAGLRTGLRDAYVAFLTAAENAGVVPAGIALLQQVIARSMPQTFDETLYYAYGFDATARCVDLRPGITLRVLADPYLNVPGTTSTPLLNGWIGAAAMDFEVQSYTVVDTIRRTLGWLVGLDAFIARMAATGALNVTVPRVSGDTQGGFGDAADFFYPGMRTAFARLFVPGTLPRPSEYLGSVNTADAFTIAAAPTFAALAKAKNLPSKNPVGWFRGRSVVRPMLPVTVDGVEEMVPLGTTLGGLLDRRAARPSPAPARLRGLRLERAEGAVVVDASAPMQAGRSRRVRVDWKALPVFAGTGGDALALPLLHGDRVVLGG
jgi:hypothetical protein